MTTEHHKHPCETVEAGREVMKLAEMILSDCGCSTAISDRLQRRVAGRIQLYVDSALGSQQQAEPVAWEYREFHDDNTVTPGWGKWKRIESEEWAGRKVLSVVADIREFIAQGYRYELRALYAQPPAVAVPPALPDWMECDAKVQAGTANALERFIAANEPAGDSAAEFRAALLAMLAAAPQGADPIKRLIAMHNELLGEYPYCYFELAYTRRTDWMAWLCTKPREDDPERKVLACGQGLTGEEACAEAISAAQKGGA